MLLGDPGHGDAALSDETKWIALLALHAVALYSWLRLVTHDLARHDRAIQRMEQKLRRQQVLARNEAQRSR